MPHHPLHKIFWIVIALISLAVTASAGYFAFANQSPRQEPFDISVTEENSIKEPAKPDTVRMMFVGDMMFDRGVESSVNRNFDGDFGKLFENLEILKEADVVFGNLEGPVSDKGRNVGSIYSFRMDPVILPILKEYGFDMVSFANNHVGDYSQAAFEDTLSRLAENNISYTGAGWNKSDVSKVKIIEKNGIKIGFLGFTDVGPNWMEAKESSAGILLASDPNFSNIITEAKAQADVLITSFHWGAEYVPFNNRQQTLAHRAVDAGADMVIGHHPHVMQDFETYNDKLIAYSLGNFIFDQYFSNETMEGMLLDITLDKNGMVDISKKVIELNRTYQPGSVRDLQDEDIVTTKLANPSLCPKISKWHEDKSLFPVDRNNSLGTYEPQKLTHMPNRIETRGTATCLDPETATAAETMFQAMNAEGLKPVMTSGYREHAIQKIVYQDWLQRQNGIVPEYPAVAEPGHSEHQLGTTIDVKSLQTAELTYDAFITSPEYRWMTQHAHEYGFVQSYPEGKEALTGYTPESWHWRYIGVDLAKRYLESGMTLNNFLSYLAS